MKPGSGKLPQYPDHGPPPISYNNANKNFDWNNSTNNNTNSNINKSTNNNTNKNANNNTNDNVNKSTNNNINTNANNNTNTNSTTSSSTASNKVTVNSNSPTNTTVTTRVSGKQRVVTPGNLSAPSLTASSVETCFGSVSGGISVMGGGASFGSTVRDEDCNRRLYARQLYNMGFVEAALYIQCLSPEVEFAMAAAGTPCARTHFAVTPVQTAPAPQPLVRKADVLSLPAAYASEPEPVAHGAPRHMSGDDGRIVLPDPVFVLFR